MKNSRKESCRMKHFIENNLKFIIRTLIFILFVLPSVILSYLALFGVHISNGQSSASLILLIVGGLALVISKLAELD